jgi:cyclic pyranopterin phosphate synthase
LHDMVKAIDPAATMNGVRLLTKDGGKRGHWTRESDPAPESGTAPNTFDTTRTAAVLVASTGGAAGTRPDTTGPVIEQWLRDRDFEVRGPLVYADADIAAGIDDARTGSPALIISTGGTGASPTDATPEATLAVLTRKLPGIAEAIRTKGLEKTPHASLSRGVAGLTQRTVIVNLPGSPGGVKDGLAVLDPIIDHLLAQVAGGGMHDE